MSPSITEMLFSIGAGKQVVGVTSYCDFPEEVQALPKVGGYYGKTISMEIIVSLSPDLIVCEEKAHGMLINQFKRLKIPYVTISNNSLCNLPNNLQILGAVSGHSETAHQKVNAIEQKLSMIKASCSKYTQSRMYWEIWDEPRISAGPKSFIAESMQILNCINIFQDAATEWPQVSDEFIILHDPEIIVLSNSRNGSITLESVFNRKGWSVISAVKNRKVFIVDEDIFSRPGLRLIDGLAELSKDLYPRIDWMDE